MPRVESSAIRRVEYDKPTSQLYVTFVSGRRYVYADVPAATYVAFLAAPSKGEFFNEQIRDIYAFVPLSDPAR